MKNVLKIALLLMLVCATIFTMTGCEKEEEPVNGTDVTTDSIVGYWKYEVLGIDFIYTFDEDGTGNYYTAGMNMPFTYKTEGKNISITYYGDEESFDTQYELKDGKLNILESTGVNVAYERIYELPKEAQVGTAGSNMPLKDRYDDAVYEIKVAFQNWLAETYGDQIFDARIYVEKIYSYEDEQEIEGLRDLELGTDEVAFDVRYEVKPAAGVDANIFTVPNGVYDEESGWVIDCYRLGVLRPIDGGEVKFEVTDIGTGW